MNLKATLFQKKIYIYALCEGLIFWYAIEKLFQQSLGFAVSTIVVIGIVAQASKILFEVPSSILADKWHRRNTLVIASAVMVLTSIGLTFIKTPFAYGVFILLWALYYALKSGTDAAFIYDSLKAYGAEKQFQKVLARYGTFEYIGLIVSSLLAGVIATQTNLKVPFWITVIPLIIGIGILLSLAEPPIEREQESEAWWKHAGQAWQEIRKQHLLWVVSLYGLLYGVQFLWYEYYQLYGLAVKTPEVWFGALLAILCLGLIVGGELVRKYTITKRIITYTWILLTAMFLTGPLINTFPKFLIALFFTMIALKVLYLSFVKVINDSIGSKRRATVISLGGAISQVLFLVLALSFQQVIKDHSVQVAFLVAGLPLLVLGFFDIIRKVPWLKTDANPTLNTNDLPGEPR